MKMLSLNVNGKSLEDDVIEEEDEERERRLTHIRRSTRK
jgi:hypothetical protein